MAYTKVLTVRDRLDETLDYAQNPLKTSLEGTIAYAMNKNKTEITCFESAFVCSLDNPYLDMLKTKARFGKTDKGVDGYHLIQSFKPGETTPEQAHEIGREFSRRYLAQNYEVIVTTHLYQKHLHNHYVFNSVAYTDGRKFRNNFDDYYRHIRVVSDEICREQHLSVIDPKGKGKQYGEWKAEREGKPTIRSLVRADVEEAIAAAISFPTFVEQLKKMGYAVKYGPNVKHMAVKPKFGEKPVRLDSLGEEYTEQAIRERIAGTYERRVPEPETAPQKRQAVLPEKPKRYRAISPIPRRRKKRKLKGFVALYWKYCYLLKLTHTRKLPNRAAFLLWDEMRKFEKYQQQFLFLYRNGIETPEQLEQATQQRQQRIGQLTAQRRSLYYERREQQDEKEYQRLTGEINQFTAELRRERRELRICEAVGREAAEIQERSNTVDEAARQTQQLKGTCRQEEKTKGKE